MIVTVRALMLGLTVYYATSTIPAQPIDTRNKLIIAAIVVVMYALLDYFAGFFGAIRRLICRLTCGYSPADSSYSSSSSSGGLDFDLGSFTSGTSAVTGTLDTGSVATEVDEALKMLNQASVKPSSCPGSTAAVLPKPKSLSEEEEGALKATGVKAIPAPSETKEGFMSYSSF